MVRVSLVLTSYLKLGGCSHSLCECLLQRTSHTDRRWGNRIPRRVIAVWIYEEKWNECQWEGRQGLDSDTCDISLLLVGIIEVKNCNPTIFLPLVAPRPNAGHGLLILEVFLWVSDQLVTETSNWQHITLTTDWHPCSRWDSNPQFQQASGRRPTT